MIANTTSKIMKHHEQIKKTYSRWVRYYDEEYGDVSYDIEFWLELCEKIKPSKVLELGIGTGRITLEIELARRGIEITGIDISSHMLQKAQKKIEIAEKQIFKRKLPITVKEGDMANFNLDSKDFDFIFVGLNTFFHLLPEEREPCFKCILQHINSDGLFGIDVFNIEEKIRSREFGLKGQGFEPIRTVRKKTDDLIHECLDQHIYNPRNRILDWSRETRIYKNNKLTKSYRKKFPLHVLPPQEMKELLSAYFEIDYQLSSLGSSEEHHFWICRQRRRF